MAGKKTDGKLVGSQKAAIILMTVEEEVASKVFAMMSEEEIKEISHAMSTLGSVSGDMVENLMVEFVGELSESTGVVGNMENVEKLLTKVLGKERVGGILEDISGPAGKTTWDKLNNVNEEVLASYLKNEYPQTAALVLTKIRTTQAARVLGVMPDEFALEVIQRMITMEPVKREVLAGIEKTLQTEFMSNLATTKKFDSFEMIAEVFNNFDRNTEGKFFDMLESRDPESAEKIRELMFTFEDLGGVDSAGIQTIIRKIDKDKMAVALKGANEKLRDLFFSNMSERAAKILQEDMDGLGPVRMRDVDEAQMYIVTIAKQLADSGEIFIPSGEDEEMIY